MNQTRLVSIDEKTAFRNRNQLKVGLGGEIGTSIFFGAGRKELRDLLNERQIQFDHMGFGEISPSLLPNYIEVYLGNDRQLEFTYVTLMFNRNGAFDYFVLFRDHNKVISFTEEKSYIIKTIHDILAMHGMPSESEFVIVYPDSEIPLRKALVFLKWNLNHCFLELVFTPIEDLKGGRYLLEFKIYSIDRKESVYPKRVEPKEIWPLDETLYHSYVTEAIGLLDVD